MKLDYCISLLVLICSSKLLLSAPVNQNKKTPDDELEDIDLEYKNYLKEVAKVLEKDEDFIREIKKITHSENFKPEDISMALQFTQHNVRTKLDELKRIEMDRLRKYAVRQLEINQGGKRKGFVLPEHLDLRNPHTFEVEDLKKLMQSVQKDVAEINKKRAEEFKKYEMEKEHNYRENLKKLNETERKEAVKKHEDMVAKHKDHPKVHHPGSKPQLEEVWEDSDNMRKEDFNSETFFKMHDLNGDEFLDEDEIQAILIRELQKMYDNNNEEDDPVERREELSRMSDHIFKEADADNDYLISKTEFLKLTQKKEFEIDDGWKGLDEELPFTEEELQEYEKMIEKKKKEMISENKI